MAALAGYKRWIAESEPLYGWNYRTNAPGQYYYDHYHSFINPLEISGTYRFNIQMYDGPTGDTWWNGEFRELNGGTDVEIMKEGGKYR